MTYQEANEVVKHLWGPATTARHAPDRNLAPSKSYLISRWTYSVMGFALSQEIARGKSWEEAIDLGRESSALKNIQLGPNKIIWKQNEFSLPLGSKNPMIRRYMTLLRLENLLERKSLWFSRGDKLGDTFEGSYPKLEETLRFIEYHDQLIKIPSILGKNPTFEKYLLKLSEINEINRRCFFSNCWSVSEHESSLMWGNYLKNAEGICIISNHENLVASFEEIFQNPITVGRVDYRDFESENIARENSYGVFFTKKKEFADEKELRTLLWLPEYDSKFRQKENPVEGFGVRVNAKKLIQKIVVSPNCSQNFLEEVRSVTQRYGFDDPIQSSLSQKPYF